jgi:hypothetical protein
MPRGLEPGAWRMHGHPELGEQPEMITGPNAILVLIKYSPTRGDIQRWAVGAATNQDVVDAAAKLKGHLAGPGQRVRWGEGVPWLAGASRLPCVAVRNAEVIKGLAR